jgi:hypothetical protein
MHLQQREGESPRKRRWIAAVDAVRLTTRE